MKPKKIIPSLCLFSACFLSGCQVSVSTDSTSKTGTASQGTISQNTAYAEYENVELTSDTTNFSSDTIYSTTADVSALTANGGNGYLTDCVITKSGATSSADNSSFLGQNASVLAKKGTLALKGGSIVGKDEGCAGIAAYSSSGIAYSQNVAITTQSNVAGGLHVCGGGKNYAWNDMVATAGEHSAAIRSDRGGGTMRVYGGTYISSGAGSPAIYCTADIQVSEATLAASGSEAFAMEGLNTTSLFDSSLEGACPASSQNDNIQWNVICYQSMSGDSASGTGRFNMVGGTLTADQGGMFFGTNTDAEFYLSGVTLVPSKSNPFLLRATGISRWSNSYSAMKTHFTADNETMTGDIIHDTKSGLTVDLIGNSVWTGASTLSTAYTGSKTSTINIESGSKWVVSGDSVIASLNNAGTIVDASGNTVTIKANGSTVVSGTSAYAITCTSYSTSTSGMAALSAPTKDTSVSFPSSL
jgi:hypothetical protein